jgi:hypothetical protein
MKLSDDGKAGLLLGLPLIGMIVLIGFLAVLIRTSGKW